VEPRNAAVATTQPAEAASAGSFAEILLAFLRLGLTSFGGPIAHLGYFRDAFVVRRRWLDEATYADLVALCQFLPGPASSQVGFAIGVARGRGLHGGLAAWLGFTLPSALALVLFAQGAAAFAGSGVLHGLKVVAVAVVAQAVWGMARSLCPDRPRAAIAVAAAVLLLLAPGSIGQIAAIVAGGVAGLVLCRDAGQAGTAAEPGHLAFPISRRFGTVCLAGFFLLLVLLPVAAAAWPDVRLLALADAFYRSGALVFGGGHVVLPLLQSAVVQPGLVGNDAFLAGYGAAQAVPGPLFTVSAFLGEVAGGWSGAAVALAAIFLPGLLVLLGALPFWDAMRRRPRVQAAMRGVNAAVVGVLLAALYTPVWTGTIHAPADFALALVAFALLTVWKAPPWIVVLIAAIGGAVLLGAA
jgi:chromate transporter